MYISIDLDIDININTDVALHIDIDIKRYRYIYIYIPTMSQARNLAAIQFTEAMATQLGLDPGSIDMVTPPLHHISSNPNQQRMQNVERSVAQMRAASASDTHSVAHQRHLRVPLEVLNQ